MALPEELVRLSLIQLDDEVALVRDAAMSSAGVVSRAWHCATESAWYRYVQVDDAALGLRLLDALTLRERARRVRRIALLSVSDLMPLAWCGLVSALLDMCSRATTLRVSNNFMLVPPESRYASLEELIIDEITPCEVTLGWFATLHACTIGGYKRSMLDHLRDSPMQLVSLKVALADSDDMVRRLGLATLTHRSKTPQLRSWDYWPRAAGALCDGCLSTAQRSAIALLV